MPLLPACLTESSAARTPPSSSGSSSATTSTGPCPGATGMKRMKLALDERATSRPGRRSPATRASACSASTAGSTAAPL